MLEQIRLSGTGGQGILMAGIVLAEGAIGAGYNAVQSQSYGPEARGGASKAEVIISSSDIDYPKVTAPGVIMALTQEAYDKYASDIVEDGLLLLDDAIELSGNDNCRICQIPILTTARDELGRVIVANMVALGALIELTKFYGYGYIEAAVLRRVPKGTEELNKKALQTGVKLVANKN